jgi:hypothetical protein
MAICKLTKAEATELQVLIDAATAANNALTERLNEIVANWDSEFEKRSKRGQEGEVGLAAQERIDRVYSWLDRLPEAFEFDASKLT